MKLAIFLVFLVALGALLYWRIRPYLAVARRVIQTMRVIRSGGEPHATSGVSNAKSKAGEKLIRCESCGVWLPYSRALSDRSSSGLSYCSADCLKKFSAQAQPQRRSALR